jgi:hypothetical protein
MTARTVAEKLLIKPDTTVWSSDRSRLALLGPLPAGITLVDGISEATTAVVFADDGGSLRATLDAHRDELTRPRVVWIAYPKGNRADINRDSLWPIVAEYGLRPIRQVAVDEVWSALGFGRQAQGEAPSGGRR